MKKIIASGCALVGLFVVGCGSTSDADDGAGAGGTASGVGGSSMVGSGGSISGSGGATTGAGGSATGSGGGAPFVPGELTGFYPTTVTDSEVRGYYDAWVSGWVEDCGDGSARVKWDDTSRTVSEGIGYGMLLAATWEDRALYDKLWAYYQRFTNSNGLMGWKVNGCSGPADDNGAATDADLDVAMSLLIADCKWSDGGYGASATTVIGAIRNHVMKTDGSRTFLCAGDGWGADCCGNASYQAPAYYRAFGVHTGDAAFWNQAADDSYYYLDKYDNDTTGLVSDWMDPDSLQCDAKGAGDWHGWDASRVPWRVVNDYAWWGTAVAQTYSEKIADFVESKGGVASTCAGYSLNGVTCGGTAVSTFAGAFASSGIASSQARADAFFQDLKGVDSQGYFNEILRTLYFTLAVKRFDYCGK